MRDFFWLLNDDNFVRKFSEYLYPILMEYGFEYVRKSTNGNSSLIMSRSVNLHTGEIEDVTFSLKGTSRYAMVICWSDWVETKHMYGVVKWILDWLYDTYEIF